MKLWSWLREERNTNRILLTAGAISMLIVIGSIFIGNIHNGDVIVPAVEALKSVDVIVGDDGQMYVQGSEDTGLTESTESQQKTEDVPFVVNINIATVYELMLIPGVGEKRALAIIEYRDTTGGFGSVNELMEVEGIGEGLFARISPYCSVEGEAVVHF